MSITLQPYCDTFVAGADLSTEQYLFHTLATDGQINPSGDGAMAIGILQDAPTAAGQAASVATAGVARVVAGAAFATGVALASNASGRAVTATTGEFILAIAKEAAAANGDIVRVQLTLGGAKVP